MKITKKHLPKSQHKRPMAYGEKRYITIHSTGNNNSTAHGEIKYLHRPDNKVYASWHYVVGEDVIYEAIPPTEISYHGGNKVANWNSISIEMVHTGNREKVINNTIELTKKLMKDFNISHENVVRHHDWKQISKSGLVWYKNCPEILNYNNWEGWIEFKTKLRMEVNDMNEKKVRQIVREEIDKSKLPVSEWAKDIWESAKEIGVTDGSRPRDYATREEVITLILRFFEKYKGD